MFLDNIYIYIMSDKTSKQYIQEFNSLYITYNNILNNISTAFSNYKIDINSAGFRSRAQLASQCHPIKITYLIRANYRLCLSR